MKKFTSIVLVFAFVLLASAAVRPERDENFARHRRPTQQKPPHHRSDSDSSDSSASSESSESNELPPSLPTRVPRPTTTEESSSDPEPEVTDPISSETSEEPDNTTIEAEASAATGEMSDVLVNLPEVLIG